MAQIRELFVTCDFCGTKLSSKAFHDPEIPEKALTKGHYVDCVNYGKQIPCNRNNTSCTDEETEGSGEMIFRDGSPSPTIPGAAHHRHACS